MPTGSTGKQGAVTFFLVDDSDGRIVATFEDLDEALVAAAEEEEQTAVALSIVSFNDAGGSVVQTDTSVTVRILEGWQSIRRPFS